ncbi:phosphatidate cytidylyltransferase [Dactylosporangium sp. NPDC051541]|uniref:phosphatidate cytidylyltransferase n=1 Tax=Dactylosporangium sp. NPDC051541 TaxID=3363977 RepID=UPI0037B71968
MAHTPRAPKAPGPSSVRARHDEAAPPPHGEEPQAEDPAAVLSEPAPAAPSPPPSGDEPTGADGTAAAPAPEKRKSRAGRNLPAAIGVGVGLGGTVVISLFVWKWLFLGVVIVAVSVGVWEMVRAVAVQKARPPLVPLLLGAPLMACLAWFGGAERLPLGLLATLLLVFVWRFADGVAHYQRDVTAGALIAVYVPFLGSFAALLAYPAHDGAVRVLVTILAVVLSDTGGYATGVFLGKHPMAPSVSPAKSWEGFAGSIFWTGVGSAIALPLLLDDAVWWHGAIFGVAVSIASVLGDLGESLIKRDLGVKDMSNLLPGHGGLMDRLDSVLLALPTAYAVLAFLVPWSR